MGGNQLHQQSKKNFKDPFDAGQMIGMLVMLTFIEQNDGISEQMLQHIKSEVATNVEEYMGMPAEDVQLLAQKLVKEIE